MEKMFDRSQENVHVLTGTQRSNPGCMGPIWAMVAPKYFGSVSRQHYGYESDSMGKHPNPKGIIVHESCEDNDNILLLLHPTMRQSRRRTREERSALPQTYPFAALPVVPRERRDLFQSLAPPVSKSQVEGEEKRKEAEE